MVSKGPPKTLLKCKPFRIRFQLKCKMCDVSKICFHTTFNQVRIGMQNVQGRSGGKMAHNLLPYHFQSGSNWNAKCATSSERIRCLKICLHTMFRKVPIGMENAQRRPSGQNALKCVSISFPIRLPFRYKMCNVTRVNKSHKMPQK